MTSKNSRTSSPSSPPVQHAPSKLPRFLQKQSTRDRSKSVTDPGPGNSSRSGSPSPEVHSTPAPGKRSKFLGLRDKDAEETPVIVEPVNIPRPRTGNYPSTPGGDLPTRLSGWFSHTFSSSSTDLSLPSLLATHASPKSKGTGGALALLTAAKHGKGHLDKAVRYLLDSDSTPDKCTDPIWLLGVQHPGYEPSHSTPSSSSSIRRGSVSPPSFRSSTSSIGSQEQAMLSQSTGSSNPKHNPGANWPPVFYIDFTSRVWLTYRSQFPVPIRDGRLADLCGSGAEELSTSTKKSPWHWVGGEKTWSSDSGWGCMLRTGQSLLANALIHVHLGRDWRKPPHPVLTADYATYVHILSWFLDTPVPEAPFSVHRMALAGKEFGTDVGQWFGPSVAAGAIKTLANDYPDAGIGIATAVDGMLYQTDVHAASHGDHFGRSPRRHTKSWGDRPVLVLVGVRLGIDGVNPIYHDTVKALYTFPQSVGIAGGRPGSSYYFVGSQADNLFYLDPHHARPAIPLRPAPPGPSPLQSQQQQGSSSEDLDREKNGKKRSSGNHRRLPTSPSSTRTSATASSTFSYHAPTSPSPLQQQFSTDSEGDGLGASAPPVSRPLHGRWRSASQPVSPGTSDRGHKERDMRLGEINNGSSENQHNYAGSVNEVNSDHGLDPVQLHYCTAYSGAEMKTFHCERVRKMPLTGLDPSMLIGFLCRDEAEWLDLRRRIADLPRTILTIQDEPPSWPDDSEDDMGLLSVSEPDEIDIDIDVEDDEDQFDKIDNNDGDELGDEDEDEDEDDDEEDQFFDTQSMSSASASPGQSRSRTRSGGRNGDRSSRNRDSNDTEEDPNDPVTPGPNSKFDIVDIGLESELTRRMRKGGESGEARAEIEVVGNEGGDDGDGREGAGEGDIEDDWVEPSLPTPMPDQYGQYPPQKENESFTMVPKPKPTRLDFPTSSSTSSASSSSAGGDIDVRPTLPPPPPQIVKTKSRDGTSRKKKGKKQVPVPVPMARTSSKAATVPQVHYPFPVTPDIGGEDEEKEDDLSYSASEDGVGAGERSSGNVDQAHGQARRMHTARARDGGRTQSGGVKGIFAEDLA